MAENNPYLDANLMTQYQQLSLQPNQQFLMSHQHNNNNSITNDTSQWDFNSINDNNISNWKWTNDSTTKTKTFQQNNTHFKWNISDIDETNDNNESIWKHDESINISNEFATIFTSKSETGPLFVGLQPHSNKPIPGKTYTDWCFNLVYIYIERIPLSKQTIIPIEVIQTCYMYFIDQNVKYLIDMLTNIKLMREYLKLINYDFKKNTFITITKSSIKQAYNIINKVCSIQCDRHNVDKIKLERKKEIINKYNMSSEIDEKMTNLYTKYELRVKGKSLLDKYYKLIEHITGLDGLENCWTYNEWMSWVKTEISLIHALNGVSQIFPNLKKTKYNLLKCNIITLLNNCQEFNIIEKYVTLTNNQDSNIKIEKIYKLQNAPYLKPFTQWKEYDNRMLLCYGDNITNVADILTNGLSIPNQNMPDLIYKFGKGIYFSDMFCDVINKCNCSSELDNGIFVLLCQVAIADKICTFHSGNLQSDASTYVTLENGCIVPCGTTIGWSWKPKYNKYVVYDTSQIKMEYLVQLTRSRKKRGIA